MLYSLRFVLHLFFANDCHVHVNYNMMAHNVTKVNGTRHTQHIKSHNNPANLTVSQNLNLPKPTLFISTFSVGIKWIEPRYCACRFSITTAATWPTTQHKNDKTTDWWPDVQPIIPSFLLEDDWWLAKMRTTRNRNTRHTHQVPDNETTRRLPHAQDHSSWWRNQPIKLKQNKPSQNYGEEAINPSSCHHAFDSSLMFALNVCHTPLLDNEQHYKSVTMYILGPTALCIP